MKAREFSREIVSTIDKALVEARMERVAIDQEIEGLARARAILAEAPAPKRRVRRKRVNPAAMSGSPSEVVDRIEKARRSAGPTAIREVTMALRDAGTTTQIDLTERVDKHPGTISYALRVLEADGVAEKTGVSVDGSLEWRFKGDEVMRPGSAGGA